MNKIEPQMIIGNSLFRIFLLSTVIFLIILKYIFNDYPLRFNSYVYLFVSFVLIYIILLIIYNLFYSILFRIHSFFYLISFRIFRLFYSILFRIRNLLNLFTNFLKKLIIFIIAHKIVASLIAEINTIHAFVSTPFAAFFTVGEYFLTCNIFKPEPLPGILQIFPYPIGRVSLFILASFFIIIVALIGESALFYILNTIFNVSYKPKGISKWIRETHLYLFFYHILEFVLFEPIAKLFPTWSSFVFIFSQTALTYNIIEIDSSYITPFDKFILIVLSTVPSMILAISVETIHQSIKKLLNKNLIQFAFKPIREIFDELIPIVIGIFVISAVSYTIFLIYSINLFSKIFIAFTILSYIILSKTVRKSIHLLLIFQKGYAAIKRISKSRILFLIVILLFILLVVFAYIYTDNEDKIKSLNERSSPEVDNSPPISPPIISKSLPKIDMFQVIPNRTTIGKSFSIRYSVSDRGGPGLSRVELRRKSETGSWQNNTTILDGRKGLYNGLFEDTPKTPGIYFYGICVFDRENNWNDDYEPSKAIVDYAPADRHETDIYPPNILEFDIAHPRLTIKSPFTITYKVSDNGDSGLNRVELWRKDVGYIKDNKLNGLKHSIPGSFKDAPPVSGDYWYEIRVFDNANNSNDEQNSQTNYLPKKYDPIRVTVIDYTTEDSRIETSIPTKATTNEDAMTWYERGNTLYYQKRYLEALRAYEKAIELDPNLALARNGEGTALECLGRYNEALQAQNKAIELDPNLAEAWSGKGNALEYLERYNEALRAYERAIELDPNLAEAWSGKGNAFWGQNRYDEALRTYERAIELNPNLAEAWSGRGVILSEQGKYDEAIKYCDEAIALEPDVGVYWNNKGNALNGIGKYEEANIAYAKAKELGYVAPGNKVLVNTNLRQGQ